jgi:ACT domain-containing protein
MPNEELIYRITRAIYERLGSTADETAVEQLATDIYQTIEPALAGNGVNSNRSASLMGSLSSGETTGAEGSAERLVVSVFGMDHPGIVAGVAQILAEGGCSIVDINQTVVQGKFAMVIIANTSRSRLSVTELKDRLRSEGEKLGVHIYAQREDLFNAMHRI